jgi:hypothetical protein
MLAVIHGFSDSVRSDRLPASSPPSLPPPPQAVSDVNTANASKTANATHEGPGPVASAKTPDSHVFPPCFRLLNSRCIPTNTQAAFVAERASLYAISRFSAHRFKGLRLRRSKKKAKQKTDRVSRNAQTRSAFNAKQASSPHLTPCETELRRV